MCASGEAANLFTAGMEQDLWRNAPLASRMRPRALEEVVGPRSSSCPTTSSKARGRMREAKVALRHRSCSIPAVNKLAASPDAHMNPSNVRHKYRFYQPVPDCDYPTTHCAVEQPTSLLYNRRRHRSRRVILAATSTGSEFHLRTHQYLQPQTRRRPDTRGEGRDN